MDGNNDSVQEKRPNRLSEYKSRTVTSDQEVRRLQLLSDQKRRRGKTFSDIRRADLFFEWDDDDLDGEVEDVMEWTKTKPKKLSLRDMFMLSEWMITVPEDFDTKWVFALCPVGKRCLVWSAKGYTTVYGKKGQRLAKFQSALPNGCQRNVTGCIFSNSKVTILDCIWSFQHKCYFVLDLLSWKGQFYMDTEMSFRTFWVKSKLEETPTLSERSEQNTYPFIPLDYHPCDHWSISSIISKHPSVSINEPNIDGILFYHSEAYYTPGLTPLVLWLKPFMLPEILNMTIPDFYSQMKPPSYIDMDHYILECKEKKTEKKKGRRKDKKVNQTDEYMEGRTADVDMFEL